MKRVFIAAVISLMMATPIWAANTIVYGNQTVGISAIDSDYDFGADSTIGSPGATKIIDFILFVPSAVNDVIVILDGAAAKPALLQATAITGDTLIVYPGKKCRPFLDFSECTFSNAANVRVTIAYKVSVGER